MATDGALRDIVDMPDYNPKAASRGQRSVSEGKVSSHPVNKVNCHVHGAMNCVNPERTIWRCIECGVGAYRP